MGHEKVNVLIVDDEPTMLWILSEYFGNSKYAVAASESAKDALPLLRALASTGKPLLLTDLNLGEESGLELLESIVSEGLGIAGVILMSGKLGFQAESIGIANQLKALEIPFFALPKPFQMKELECLFDRMLPCQQDPDQSLATDAASQALERSFTYLYARSPGKILERARNTLQIDVQSLISAANSLGFPLSEETYGLYERDPKFASKIGAHEWLFLCDLLEIPSDSAVDGYSQRLHLERARGAIKEGLFRLPITDALRQWITKLEKRETPESEARDSASLKKLPS